MPTSEEILVGVGAIANEWRWVAIAWHAILAGVFVAISRGWRPSHRRASMLVAALPASVAWFAFAAGNPFNGALFAVATVSLVGMALPDRRGPVCAGPRWTTWAAIAMITYAWIYPHFLEGSPAWYLVAAPVGLVPCPSLSMAIGLALLAGGLGSRAWRLSLAGLGALYGIYGIFRLGVALDLGLLAGAGLLGATTQRARGRPGSPAQASVPTATAPPTAMTR